MGGAEGRGGRGRKKGWEGQRGGEGWERQREGVGGAERRGGVGESEEEGGVTHTTLTTWHQSMTSYPLYTQHWQRFSCEAA